MAYIASAAVARIPLALRNSISQRHLDNISFFPLSLLLPLTVSAFLTIILETLNAQCDIIKSTSILLFYLIYLVPTALITFKGINQRVKLIIYSHLAMAIEHLIMRILVVLSCASNLLL